jgi:hypothetical protein
MPLSTRACTGCPQGLRERERGRGRVCRAMAGGVEMGRVGSGLALIGGSGWRWCERREGRKILARLPRVLPPFFVSNHIGTRRVRER